MQVRAKKGFTLLELIIVVSIAVVFYSLILPSIPASPPKKSSISIEEAALRLCELGQSKERGSMLEFKCFALKECGFYDGEKLAEGGYSLALDSLPQEFERDGVGDLRKKTVDFGEPIVSLRLSKNNALLEAVYFCDDYYVVVGGVKNPIRAPSLAEAKKIVYAEGYAALSEDVIAK